MKVENLPFYLNISIGGKLTCESKTRTLIFKTAFSSVTATVNRSAEETPQHGHVVQGSHSHDLGFSQ